MKLKYSRHLLLGILIIALGSSTALFGANYAPSVDGSYTEEIWEDAANGGPLTGTPSATDDVFIRNGKTVTLGAGQTGYSGLLQVANTPGSSGVLNVYGSLSSSTNTGSIVNSIGLRGTGTMNVYTGGSYSINNWILTVGSQEGNGTLNIDGGSVSISGSTAREVRIAINGTSSGLVRITNGGRLQNDTSATIQVGNSADRTNGRLQVIDGSLSANRIQVYNNSTLTIGHNATLSLRSTATTSGTGADRGLTIGTGAKLRFELGNTGTFNALDLSNTSIWFNVGAIFEIDVTGFSPILGGQTDIELLRLSLDSSRNSILGSGDPSVSIIGLEENAYLSNETTYQWVKDGSDNIIGLKLIATPIPEPSTYAAILGILTISGIMIHRRRRNN